MKFDANLGFQQEAISAITDIFIGQKICQGNFSVKKTEEEINLKENVLGYGNRLELVDEELSDNVHVIQLRNGLEQSSEVMIKTRNFSIWMETGTGKTYVYLRTIFELNKLYGFTKFIIVVPSIAIKEGVNNSLALMDSHFKAQYNNVPYDYFVYDSGNDAMNAVFSNGVAQQTITAGNGYFADSSVYTRKMKPKIVSLMSTPDTELCHLASAYTAEDGKLTFLVRFRTSPTR